MSSAVANPAVLHKLFAPLSPPLFSIPRVRASLCTRVFTNDTRTPTCPRNIEFIAHLIMHRNNLPHVLFSPTENPCF